MQFFEKRPMLLLTVGILGISMSSVFVRYSDAPAAVTAAFRLLWTVLLVTCALQGHDLFGSGVTPVAVGLALAVFSTVLGHSIFSWCLKYFSPSFVSASKLCEPVGAGLLAALLFAEIPTPLQLLGSTLILGGVFAYSRLEKTE